ncbi:MAG: hypothetical protein Q4C96_03765 [Planctomycetia bacterium]|nr:hypothetical protein [Planctomycetia bacterium]
MVFSQKYVYTELHFCQVYVVMDILSSVPDKFPFSLSADRQVDILFR